MLLVSTLLFILVHDGFLVFYEGILFIVLLIMYVLFLLRRSKKNNEAASDDNGSVVPQKTWLLIVMVLGATAALAIGSELLIRNAQIVATNWGVDEGIVYISVVAFGTSLPELATSVIAAMKKEMDISVGNIVGSNIFNILSVLGISSLLTRIEVSERFISFDIPCMLIMSTVLYLFLLPANKSKLTGWKGALMLVAYIGFVVTIYLKG